MEKPADDTGGAMERDQIIAETVIRCLPEDSTFIVLYRMPGSTATGVVSSVQPPDVLAFLRSEADKLERRIDRGPAIPVAVHEIDDERSH